MRRLAIPLPETWRESGAGRILAAAEISVMTALILSYIWVWQDSFPGDFLLVAAAYFAIGVIGHLARGESLWQIGVRLDNWRPALRNASIAMVPLASVPLVAGGLLGSWHFPAWGDAALTLPASVAWGTAQQYGLLCVLYRRLQEALDSPDGATAAAALLFALFHLPNGLLMGVTLIAGVVACMLYRREPNVPVIGAAHAVVSFILYYALPESLTGGLRVGPGYFTGPAG